MKHLKQYEENNQEEQLYKDYMVVNSLNNHKIPLFILSTDQIKNKESDTLFYYKSYSYFNIEENKMVKDSHHSSIKKDRILILYQSDNLQECLDMMPTLLAQNKFNL